MPVTGVQTCALPICLIEANLVPEATKLVKIIVSGAVTKAYTVKDKGVTATKGAKSAVEAAGGRFEV